MQNKTKIKVRPKNSSFKGSKKFDLFLKQTPNKQGEC